MKRYASALMVIIALVAFSATVFAAGRIHKTKEFYFGDDYHKSPAGVRLSYLDLKWDDTGVSRFIFTIAAFRKKVIWEDMYFVSTVKGKTGIVYKLSDHQKMGKSFFLILG